MNSTAAGWGWASAWSSCLSKCTAVTWTWTARSARAPASPWCCLRAWPRHLERPSLLFGLVPDRSINLLVKRWATGRELALLVMLGTHEGRAIAERAADALALELAVLLDLADEVGLGQRGPAHADEGGAAIANIGRAGMDQKFLQITVAA